MNKDEILAKNKNEGSGERVQSVWLSSFAQGNMITLILCFIFIAINGIKGKSYTEVLIIALASQSATDFYKYKELKDKKNLLVFIYAGLLAIVSFILFIIKG
ncbi:DUF6442 family protein [Clostridium sp.]|uniref:DUF6442 family protein n=1 Tax=Clostridium sp. TaxID=1506 RepID=UPI001A3DEB85|nr:DUF6442 family protein [Clostridium sp.]MBK5239713.1 hypothetical protein [Clostridium sp.]